MKWIENKDVAKIKKITSGGRLQRHGFDKFVKHIRNITNSFKECKNDFRG